MTDHITLPGDIPWLLRPHSPGIYPAAGQRVHILSVTESPIP